MVKQMVEDETADKADWLIGEGCLLPDVKGVSLRSMKAPGTAYDDPRMVSLFASVLTSQNCERKKAALLATNHVHHFAAVKSPLQSRVLRERDYSGNQSMIVSLRLCGSFPSPLALAL